jgi:hypothetical protein
MRNSLKAVATATLALVLTFGVSGVANAGTITINSGATGCCRLAV